MTFGDLAYQRQAHNYPNNLPGIWESLCSYLHHNYVAPVLVGEFGTKLLTTSDTQWFDTMISYLKPVQIKLEWNQ